MTQGVKSHGAGFAIGDGASPESWTALSEPRTIPELGGKSGLIDASNHDSTSYMDYMPKELADGNEIQVESNYIEDNAGIAAFDAARASKAQYNFKYSLSNGEYYIFPGRVIADDIAGGEMDDMIIQKYTIKIVGHVAKYT
jgi:hypothetical protein